jgi:hypothetical protein
MDVNNNERREDGARTVRLVASALLLVALEAFLFHGAHSAAVIRIWFDRAGTAHLGPIPLQSEKVCKGVLAAVHRIWPKTPFELAASEGAPFTNVVVEQKRFMRTVFLIGPD